MEATARQLQKAATRERVMDTALALFAARGIVATTTADIAKAVGMSHGVIFLHFARRDDLVIAVIDEFGRRLQSELRRALEGGRTLRGVLSAHLRALTEFEPFYARLVTEVALLPPKVRSTLLMLQAAVSTQVDLAFRQERAQGRLKELPRHLLFNPWLGLVHHYVANRDLFTEGPSVLAEKQDELVNHFLALVSA